LGNEKKKICKFLLINEEKEKKKRGAKGTLTKMDGGVQKKKT